MWSLYFCKSKIRRSKEIYAIRKTVIGGNNMAEIQLGVVEARYADIIWEAVLPLMSDKSFHILRGIS